MPLVTMLRDHKLPRPARLTEGLTYDLAGDELADVLAAGSGVLLSAEPLEGEAMEAALETATTPTEEG